MKAGISLFEREIAARQPQDGGELLRLACGHEVYCVIPYLGRFLFCSVCLERFLSKHHEARARRMKKAAYR